MRNYLISLARRGAGLAQAQSPQPSRTPDFSTELEETKTVEETETDAADSTLGEIESASTAPGISESKAQEKTPGPIAPDTFPLTAQPAAQPVRVTPRVTPSERLENNFGSASDSSRAQPTELSQESPPLLPPSDPERRMAETASPPSQVLPQVLPDVGDEIETHAQRDEPGRAPLHIHQAPVLPVTVETASENKALDLSDISKPDEAAPPQPGQSTFTPPSQSTFTPAAPDSSTSLEREIESPAVSHSIEGRVPVIPEPQAVAAPLRGSLQFETVPEEKEPRIEVHIGRVEVRFAQTPTPAPPVRQPSRPRGFNEYALARRYLDRNWY